MAVVKYLARRSLTLGTSIGEQVVFDLPVKNSGITPQRQAVSTSRTSMTGQVETYYYRAKVTYTISFIPVDANERDAMNQFLDSVEDGQVFSFAPDASSTTPSPEYRNVQRDPPQASFPPHQDKQALTVFSPLTLVEVP